MKPLSITVRIYWKDWKALRRLYPAEKGENIGMYFERVVKLLDKNKLTDRKKVLNYWDKK